jgi:hypothetical protein
VIDVRITEEERDLLVELVARETKVCNKRLATFDGRIGMPELNQTLRAGTQVRLLALEGVRDALTT